jgi:UDP-glucose 4-epimerase
MQTCLVTGGAGFIGSNLVDALIRDGNEVIVIDDFSTGHYKTNKATYSWWDSKFPEKIDVVFHLAALARIQPSFYQPQKTYDVNSTLTMKALDIAMSHGARLVYAGSSSVYHDPFANPYSYTKWLGEQHCLLYSKLYKLPCAIARFFNVYGPRQIEEGEFSTVIGIFEKQYRENKPLTVTGDGEQRRDFTHVKDIVRGLIAMSKSDWHGDIFNLGTGTNYSINEVADLFQTEKQYLPKRPGEAQDTLADISYTKEKLAWEPTISLRDYVNEVVMKKKIVDVSLGTKQVKVWEVSKEWLEGKTDGAKAVLLEVVFASDFVLACKGAQERHPEKNLRISDGNHAVECEANSGPVEVDALRKAIYG